MFLLGDNANTHDLLANIYHNICIVIQKNCITEKMHYCLQKTKITPQKAHTHITQNHHNSNEYFEADPIQFELISLHYCLDLIYCRG